MGHSWRMERVDVTFSVYLNATNIRLYQNSIQQSSIYCIKEASIDNGYSNCNLAVVNADLIITCVMKQSAVHYASK
jgi:hypothetical protein